MLTILLGQMVVGGSGGLFVKDHLVHAESRIAGSPDTFFALPMAFEATPAAGTPFRIDLLEALETLGSGIAERDTWLFVRNGGTDPLDLTVRVFEDGGSVLGSTPDLPITVAAGESRRISVEDALALVGAPVGPDPAVFRGQVTVTGEAVGPLAVSALRIRQGNGTLGGSALPATIR